MELQIDGIVDVDVAEQDDLVHALQQRAQNLDLGLGDPLGQHHGHAAEHAGPSLREVLRLVVGKARMKKPRLGMISIRPMAASALHASRIGPRLTPSAATARSR